VKLSEHPRLSHLSHPTSAASSYAARQRSPRKHLTGVGLVVLLHVLLLWAISSGLAKKVVRLTENTVEAVLLTDAPPPPAGSENDADER
jgi:protein TonB